VFLSAYHFDGEPAAPAAAQNRPLRLEPPGELRDVRLRDGGAP
jgi:hypothetical protein